MFTVSVGSGTESSMVTGSGILYIDNAGSGIALYMVCVES